MQKKIYLLVAVIAFNLCMLSAAHSAFYKWVDKNGQVHYTQTPPKKEQMSKKTASKALANSKKDTKSVSNLVGNWVGTRKGKNLDENVAVDFHLDGRFEDRSQKASGFVHNGVGKWTVDGEMIKWDYGEQQVKWRYAGKGKHYSFIEKLTDKSLHIREPDGSLTKLMRAENVADGIGEETKEEMRLAACNKKVNKGMTAGEKWVVMIQNNCIEKAKEMFKRGLDPNAESANKTPLILAIELKKKAFVKFLVKNGADLNAGRKSDGVTPLILAAKMGEYQVVNTLIGVGAKLDANDMSQNTALIIAAKENQEMIVKRLLSMGANVNAKDGKGMTALKHAKDRGYGKIVKTIEDYKKLTGSH